MERLLVEFNDVICTRLMLISKSEQAETNLQSVLFCKTLTNFTLIGCPLSALALTENCGMPNAF